MNMNRLINMVIRQLMNRGISKGVQMASRRGQQPGQNRPAGPNTQGQAKQAQQGLRLMRRFMR